METKMEGVGVPVAVSGIVESVSPSLSSPENKVEALRRVSVFADLPDDQLQWFADHTEEHRFQAGEILFRKGEPAAWMTIYLEGEIHAYLGEKAHDGYVYISRAGEPKTEVS